jgi:hypothetical protein
MPLWIAIEPRGSVHRFHLENGETSAGSASRFLTLTLTLIMRETPAIKLGGGVTFVVTM